MSSKNISKSAIEGGRYVGNKQDRNASHREERSRSKTWMNKVAADIDFADGSVARPRNYVEKGFTDKLSPCYRWLASKKGKSWNKVFAELTSKFDTRKLASYHVVIQHMLVSIRGIGGKADSLNAYYRFFVDKMGRLQDHGKFGTWDAKKRKLPTEAQALEFSAGRKVMMGETYRDYWWVVPVVNGIPCVVQDKLGKTFVPAAKIDQSWQPCKGKCDVKKHLHRNVETTPAELIAKYSSAGYLNTGKGDWWRTYAAEHLTDTWAIHRKLSTEEVKWFNSLAYSTQPLVRIEQHSAGIVNRAKGISQYDNPRKS